MRQSKTLKMRQSKTLIFTQEQVKNLLGQEEEEGQWNPDNASGAEDTCSCTALGKTMSTGCNTDPGPLKTCTGTRTVGEKEDTEVEAQQRSQTASTPGTGTVSTGLSRASSNVRAACIEGNTGRPLYGTMIWVLL
jgi:hypothetical protein